MTLPRKPIPLTLRGALCAVALATMVSACTRTEVTELDCVRVADAPQADPQEMASETVVCNERRYRLVLRDKFYEPPVVSDETW